MYVIWERGNTKGQAERGGRRRWDQDIEQKNPPWPRKEMSSTEEEAIWKTYAEKY